MELQPDCVRSVLLVLEAKLKVEKIRGRMVFHPIKWQILADYQELSDYQKEDVFYTLFKLKEAGYIRCLDQVTDNYVDQLEPYDITYSGYEFLKNIRSDHVWASIKKAAEAVGTTSLSVLSQYAAKFVLQNLLQG